MIVDDVVAQVAATVGVEASAITFINSVPTLISTAVTAAIANGATAAQLAPLTKVVSDLKTSAGALQAALTANAPPTP